MTSTAAVAKRSDPRFATAIGLLGRSSWAVLASASLVLLAGSVVRGALDPARLLPVVFVLTWISVGGLIVRRKPHDAMALIAAVFLTAFPLMFADVAAVALPEWPTAAQSVAFLGLASLQLFLYVFPDGRFVPGWMRWSWLACVLYFGVRSFGDLSARVPVVDGLLFVATTASTVLLQVYRYRRVSSPVEREQTLVVLYGVSVAIAGSLGLIALDIGGAFGPSEQAERFVTPMLYVLVLPIPASLLASILRFRLWDIDLLINRTLVHGTLALVLLGGYLSVVLGASVIMSDLNWLPLSVLTLGLIALIFQPLHQRLQTAVNRLMYGERDDPYHVLARLAQHLRSALEPDAVIAGIVDTVAAALRLPYVAIELEGSATVARGELRGTPVRWPLEYRRVRLGSLVACPRRGDSFGAADSRLLTDLASQAGVALHAVGLTAALQQARERLVIAREEERRRLRRDLHDQLGATIGALTVKTGAAGSLLHSDPNTAAAIIGEIEQELKAAVGEIRRIAYGLRPPLLDERGLMAAIQECAAQQLAGSGVRPVVEAERGLPPLPAAVELALFLIAQEALVNVARHSRARRCHIRMALASGTLRLEVTDDGVGMPAESRWGVGLASMRERAAELGGTCRIESGPTSGISVVATLPMPKGNGA